MSKVTKLAERARERREAEEASAHRNNVLLALLSNAPGGKLFVPHAAIAKLNDGDGASMQVDDQGITLFFVRSGAEAG